MASMVMSGEAAIISPRPSPDTIGRLDLQFPGWSEQAISRGIGVFAGGMIDHDRFNAEGAHNHVTLAASTLYDQVTVLDGEQEFVAHTARRPAYQS